MAAMTKITCACGCGRQKEVRTADVKRGWGKYFDKSCKARHQEKRTGKYRKYLTKQADSDSIDDDWGIHPLSDDNFSMTI